MLSHTGRDFPECIKLPCKVARFGNSSLFFFHHFSASEGLPFCCVGGDDGFFFGCFWFRTGGGGRTEISFAKSLSCVSFLLSSFSKILNPTPNDRSVGFKRHHVFGS